jgi:hypothetical protein
MTITIQELLEQVPPETEDIVNKTRIRFNTTIRQMLRQETGLRLGGSKNKEDELQDGHSIRVFVEPGVPEELERLRFDEHEWLAIMLAPMCSELSALRMSANTISQGLINKLPKDITEEGRFSGVGGDLMKVRDFSDHLLEIAQSLNLVKKLHAINEDIFGHYIWRSSGNEQTTASINLYWGAIGLVARSLNISVQGLTIKVLAHELAHAFTHLGADIDGHRWRDKDFGEAKREVKEGLAQYYTSRIVNRLKDRMPEAEDAYKTLLPHQPPAYQIQEEWIASGVDPEHVRLAMVKFRRFGARTLDEFESFLKDSKNELGSNVNRW